MLNPKLTNCTECPDILSLLGEIECRLKELSYALYNNIVFMMDKPVPAEAITDLLHYRRILQYKHTNPNYALPYTFNIIASRVKLLIFKK